MSADALSLIASGLGGLLTIGIAMFAGFAWVVRRVDSVEQRLGSRIDSVERDLSEFRSTVEHEFTEVKIAIARIEGPRPRLIIER